MTTSTWSLESTESSSPFQSLGTNPNPSRRIKDNPPNKYAFAIPKRYILKWVGLFSAILSMTLRILEGNSDLCAKMRLFFVVFSSILWQLTTTSFFRSFSSKLICRSSSSPKASDVTVQVVVVSMVSDSIVVWIVSSNNRKTTKAILGFEDGQAKIHNSKKQGPYN